jgi:hypothetical protein
LVIYKKKEKKGRKRKRHTGGITVGRGVEGVLCAPPATTTGPGGGACWFCSKFEPHLYIEVRGCDGLTSQMACKYDMKWAWLSEIYKRWPKPGSLPTGSEAIRKRFKWDGAEDRVRGM